jgi:hypothetical protein
MVNYNTGIGIGASKGRYAASFSGEGLTDDQIRKVAPSVFANEAHESRSSRYAYVNTAEFLEGLRGENFRPVYVTQGKCRTVGKAEYTKHLIRFRKADQVAVQGHAAEVVMVNSHDGTTRVKLYQGMIRFACFNGLITMEPGKKELSVAHKGGARQLVIEGAYEVLGESIKALDSMRAWSEIKLSGEEQLIFANAAHIARFGEPDKDDDLPAPEGLAAAIKPSMLLARRRQEDTLGDLWTTYNVVQENILTGGLRGMAPSTNEEGVTRMRRHTTRPIQGIDQNVNLNRALWSLTAQMAKLKSA